MQLAIFQPIIKINNKMETHKYTNNLVDESSPYLLQHAHNPVNWFAWGEKALQKAKNEDKLLLVSIGYSACHWCHVMEKESFEDECVADIMNQYFVCIKVDREERPDIDQIYMEAVHIMTGSGGWPLNCFALPDGRPVYGGTYFQKDQWKHVLESLANMNIQDKQKLLTAANELTSNINRSEVVELKQHKREYQESDLKEIVKPWKSYFDKIEGGSNHAPKFPMPNSYEFLLAYARNTDDPEVLGHVKLTLDKMCYGGIYDQVGGGFARYSVDKYWKVPHFEKMLYDNAQLISLYSKAYQQTKTKEYKRVVYQSIEFIDRELTSSEGAFYSSLDADSEGEEGKFYVWEKQELDNLLGNDSEIYCDYYQVSQQGNWEHKQNILFRKENSISIAEKFKIPETELIEKIDILNKIVLIAREKRIRPGLDNKILTSWNALMLKAYVDAYRAFNEDKFLEKAIKNAHFIIEKVMDKDFRLSRNYKNSKASINAFLDDYAFTIESFITLYQASFEEKWLLTAQNLTEYVVRHFYDNHSGMFFYTSDIDPKLIARKMEINDNVIPASNSAMAKNLFYLGKLFYNDDFLKLSEKMLQNVKDDIKKSGSYYSNWAILLANFVYQPYEIAICGENAADYRIAFEQHGISSAIFAGSINKSDLPILKGRYKEGKTTIYVCKDRVCKMPVYSVEDAIRLIGI